MFIAMKTQRNDGKAQNEIVLTINVLRDMCHADILLKKIKNSNEDGFVKIANKNRQKNVINGQQSLLFGKN